MIDQIQIIADIREDVKTLMESQNILSHVSILAGEKGLISPQQRQELWADSQPFVGTLRQIDKRLEALKQDIKQRSDSATQDNMLKKIINLLRGKTK